jgi:hypothetical protein
MHPQLPPVFYIRKVLASLCHETEQNQPRPSSTDSSQDNSTSNCSGVLDESAAIDSAGKEKVKPKDEVVRSLD